VAHVTGSIAILYCVPQNVLLLKFMNHVFIIVNCGIKEYWCSSLYFWTLLAIATSFKFRSLENMLPH